MMWRKLSIIELGPFSLVVFIILDGVYRLLENEDIGMPICEFYSLKTNEPGNRCHGSTTIKMTVNFSPILVLLHERESMFSVDLF